MARRRSPQNKAHTAAPENKEPFTEDDTEAQDIPAEEIEDGDPDEDDQDDMLTAFAEKDAQLRRLLKAENNEYVGTIGRNELRRVADSIRAELRGTKEVDMGGTDDGA